ncbi:tRNA (adenosine(37)-N6)-threonylcarbamoyltransferase complex ATPase subunit type 1 TsaE [Erysipelotrichaceae bacterium 66-17]
MKFEIHSLDETRQFAQVMADLVKGYDMVICLSGDLGAGKTTWTQTFGRRLGVSKVINSPTFNIMKAYKQGDGKPFYHIDAYRLEGIDQDLGFEECFDEGVCVIEWSHFIENQIPDDHIEITILEGMDEDRSIEMIGLGDISKQIVKEYEHDHTGNGQRL